MAKRPTRRKAHKIQPAVQSIHFQFSTDHTGALDTTNYIDLGLAASIANRRFYRQGLNWAVANVTITAKGNGQVQVSKIPTTWVASNAWHKSFKMWQQMNEQVLDDEPSIKSKYHDFKVLMDYEMQDAEIQQSTSSGIGPFVLTPIDALGNLTGADFTGAVPPRADWEYSKIHIPNDAGVPGATVEYDMHFVGDSETDSVGLIHGYAKSRSRPQERSPNVPLGSGWMVELFDLGNNDEEIKEDLIDDNDRPPYAVIGASSSRETYPGGSENLPGLQLVDYAEFTNTTVSAKNHFTVGNVPCGLLKLQVANDATAEGGIGSVLVRVDLVPGHHRGYLCEPMQDM